MRTIDADALKKEWRMGDVCETCDQDTRQCGNDYCFSRMDVCGMIDDAPTVATDTNVLNKWINVKDKLPELGTPVLFIGKTIYRAWFSTQRGWYDGTFWRRNDGEAVYSTTPVTHWMPLPKPPKEVKQE